MTSRKPRILIVEDEPAIRNGLIDVFTFHGFAVDSAATGTAGLSLALRGGYALILLDVMLPGIDGFEICNRIRAADRIQPIILLTAKSHDEDIIQGLTLGADDYVTKPFSVAELGLRVNAVLRRAGFDDATPNYEAQLEQYQGGCTLNIFRLSREAGTYVRRLADAEVTRCR